MLAALSLKQPDRVPVFDWIDERVVWGMADLLGYDTSAADVKHQATRHGEESDAVLDTYCRLIEELDIDATWSSYSTGLEPESSDWAWDKYGRGFMLSEHGIPAIMDSGVKTLDDALNFDMASRLEEGDFNMLKTMVSRFGRDKCHVQSINGPFQESWLVRGGMEKTFLDMADRSESDHAVGRLTTDFNKAVIDISYGLGADVIVLDGDLTGNDYMLMSMVHYLEFIKPYKKELVDHIHSKSMKAVKHSDGNMWALMDEMVEIGFDGFHPVQPQCMTIAESKAYLLGRICLFGNVDCLDLLVYGTPEEVEEATRRTIMAGSPGGGHILCSSNSLHPGVKPENALAMFRAAKKYGDYADIPLQPTLRAEDLDMMKLTRATTRRRIPRGARARRKAGTRQAQK
jgi:uroporphyrinogen decarboxylase